MDGRFSRDEAIWQDVIVPWVLCLQAFQTAPRGMMM
jgi:hypothetical protein